MSTSNKKEENMGASTHRDKPIYHLRTNLIESKDGDKKTSLLSRVQITCQAVKENVFTIYQIVLLFEMLKHSVNHI